MKLNTKDAYTRVYCYDPGGTTGFALLDLDHVKRTITVKELGEFSTWANITTHSEAIKPNECFLYEDFKLRIITANLIPVEVIGVIRYICGVKGLPMFKQMPHERKVAVEWYKELNSIDNSTHWFSALSHGIVFVNKSFSGKDKWTLLFHKSVVESTLKRKK